MQASLFKIVSIMVLISVISMFTGVAEPVSAAPLTKAEKTCCDGCDSDEGQESAPCSTPVCPAFLCLSFDAVEIFVPQVTSLITTSNYSFVVQPILKQFTKSIFHPPAIV